jgi:hypothetical protein
MIIFLLVLTPILGEAFAQYEINVTETEPCFMNTTASYKMFENCGARDDWLNFALAPFEWVTGGYFSLILVSVLILGTYMKYHKTIYPIMIGILFIPISIALFPQQWVNFAILLIVPAIAILILKTMFKQTKEY